MKRPDWIRSSVPTGTSLERFENIIEKSGLKTVCREADCPNRCECWHDGEATFMILGDNCTRGCLFCNVASSSPTKICSWEPQKIAQTVKKLAIKYAVITSVTRDDLPDCGASQFRMVVEALRSSCPDVPVELLIPDFHSAVDPDDHSVCDIAIEQLVSAGPQVVGHNIEMPEKLYARIRERSNYSVSLGVLRKLTALRRGGAEIFVKSSIILGLGEEEKDILKTIDDIKDSGVEILCIGQYLSPSARHWPVFKYYSPDYFDRLRDICLDMGFKAVISSPLARSSYHARKIYLELLCEGG